MPQLENLSWRAESGLERINCNFCGSMEHQFVLTENGLDIVRCRSCGLVYVNPRPTPEQLTRFYEQYFPPESEDLWQKQMKYIFQREGCRVVKRYHPRRSAGQAAGRVLDVGCGMGFFLSLLKKQHYECQGIEISPAAADFARRRLGLEVIQKPLAEAGFQDDFFETVTLWYVLEHVPNPREILQKVYRLLKKDGLVIIRTPQLNVRIDKWLFRLGKLLPPLAGRVEKLFLINPPRHLYDYTADNLCRLLKQLGFKNIRMINSYPRSAGSGLALARRYGWYLVAQIFFWLSRGEIVLNSSVTIYARK